MLEEKSQTKRTGKGVKTVKKPTVAKDVTIVAAKQSAKSTEVNKIQPKLRRLRSKRVTVEDPDYRPKRTKKTPKKFIDFDCMASELSDGIGQEEKDIGQPAQKGGKH